MKIDLISFIQLAYDGVVGLTGKEPKTSPMRSGNRSASGSPKPWNTSNALWPSSRNRRHMGLFVTYSALILSRLGMKWAERQKWLPRYYYHQLSVQKLKEGDLKVASRYNSIALAKCPNSERAQVVREKRIDRLYDELDEISLVRNTVDGQWG